MGNQFPAHMCGPLIAKCASVFFDSLEVAAATATECGSDSDGDARSSSGKAAEPVPKRARDCEIPLFTQTSRARVPNAAFGLAEELVTPMEDLIMKSQSQMANHDIDSVLDHM